MLLSSALCFRRCRCCCRRYDRWCRCYCRRRSCCRRCRCCCRRFSCCRRCRCFDVSINNAAEPCFPQMSMSRVITLFLIERTLTQNTFNVVSHGRPPPLDTVHKKKGYLRRQHDAMIYNYTSWSLFDGADVVVTGAIAGVDISSILCVDQGTAEWRKSGGFPHMKVRGQGQR